MPTWMQLTSDEQLNVVRLYNEQAHETLRKMAEDYGVQYRTLLREAQKFNAVLNAVGMARPGYVAPPEYISPSIERQMNLFQKCDDMWFSYAFGSGPDNGFKRVMWVGDKHYPYHDPDVESLEWQVRRDFKPDITVEGNDAFDFEDFSRWPDTRTAAAKLWGSDIENGYRFFRDKQIMLDEAWTPEQKIWINGNHDLWMYRFLRERAPATAEKNIADWIQFLTDENGILVFSDKQDAFQISINLVLAHGWGSPSANPATYANKMIKDCAAPFYNENRGKTYDVMYGHDHRSGKYLSGANTAYSVGCACLTDVRYGGGAPFKWVQSFALGYIDFNQKNHDFEIVNIYSENGKKVCYYGGKRYVS